MIIPENFNYDLLALIYDDDGISDEIIVELERVFIFPSPSFE